MNLSTNPRPLRRPSTWAVASIALCALGVAVGIAWFPALVEWAVRTLDPVSLIGHASYLLAALSFAQSRMLRLRLLAIASFALGLLYNGLVHLQMPEGQHLWPTPIWLSAFLAQNLYHVLTSAGRGRNPERVLGGEIALVHPATTARPE